MKATVAAQADREVARAGFASGATGTYALALHCTRHSMIRVGSLGLLETDPGLYFYVGSAFGPGGLCARVGRHAGRRKRDHWHIDALRKQARFLGAWISPSPHRLEHEWAKRMMLCEGAIVPLARFGASDCRCASHLTWLGRDERALDEVGHALVDGGPAPGFVWLPAREIRRVSRSRRRGR